MNRSMSVRSFWDWAPNLAAAFGHGYPVAGGLSQSALNDNAGGRTPLALGVA